MAMIKVTIVGRYEVEPEAYKTDDESQMAAEDQEAYENGDFSVSDILSWIYDRDLIVKFEAE